MRRYAVLLVALLLIVGSAVPAFAAVDSNGRWVPDMPPFVQSSGGGAVTITVPYSRDGNSAVKSFFSSLDSSPYFVVTWQGNWNGYTDDGKNVGDDRQWWLAFVRPKLGGNGGSFSFRSALFDIVEGTSTWSRMNNSYANPVRLYSPNGFEIVAYQYDYAAEKLTGGTVVQSVGYLWLSYVVGYGNQLADTSSQYPGARTLLGGDESKSWGFETGCDNPQYPDRYYDWWVGYGPVKDVPVDPDPDPEDPEEPDRPWWDPEELPPKPDDSWVNPPASTPGTPVIPYDPGQGGGYTPPADNTPYDPLPDGWTPPTMPDFPGVEVPTAPSNPFDDLQIPGSPSDPFDSVKIPGAGSDPFGTITVPGSNSNPFAGILIPGSSSNPFGSLSGAPTSGLWDRVFLFRW